MPIINIYKAAIENMPPVYFLIIVVILIASQSFQTRDIIFQIRDKTFCRVISFYRHAKFMQTRKDEF